MRRERWALFPSAQFSFDNLLRPHLANRRGELQVGTLQTDRIKVDRLRTLVRVVERGLHLSVAVLRNRPAWSGSNARDDAEAACRSIVAQAPSRIARTRGVLHQGGSLRPETYGDQGRPN
jgi:hypothetical protein